jgi:hypothetical protein
MSMTMPRVMTLALLVLGACQRAEMAAPEADVGGAVRLGLVLSPGVEVALVSYRITGVGIAPREGSIDVRQATTPPSTLITGLPPRSGYSVVLTAFSTDARTTCMGSAGFSVQAGQTASVTVLLECRAPGTTGAIAVESTFNHCPEVQIIVSGSAPGIGVVRASVFDPDSSSFTYRWTASGGQVDNPTAGSTGHRCTITSERSQVRVEVSDGHCTSAAETSFSCLFPEPPPQCDACVAANCAAEGPGCSSLSDPTRRALCESLFACARRTNCGGQNNAACWCGTVDLNTCTSVPGAADGPCVAEELAAAETTVLGAILERFADPAWASGAAHNRLLCEFELCPDVCPPR